MSAGFAILEALGARVRTVQELEEGWLYVVDKKILFINDELDAEAIDCAMDRVLHELFETGAVT